jgi:hypothetical protein
VAADDRGAGRLETPAVGRPADRPFERAERLPPAERRGSVVRAVVAGVVLVVALLVGAVPAVAERRALADPLPADAARREGRTVAVTDAGP